MSAQALEVERIVRASGSSFYWGMRLLPMAERRALYAVYAFCRRADDIADAPGAPEDRLAGLERWRLEVDREQAARYGADVALLGNAVQMVTTGSKVSTYRPEDQDDEVDNIEYHIRAAEKR